MSDAMTFLGTFVVGGLIGFAIALFYILKKNSQVISKAEALTDILFSKKIKDKDKEVKNARERRIREIESRTLGSGKPKDDVGEPEERDTIIQEGESRTSDQETSERQGRDEFPIFKHFRED